MSLYNIKNFEGHYVIAKFTNDLDLESTYEYHIIDGVHTCHCPAGVRPTCRHRQMFPMLSLRLDTSWFLDFDTRQWVDPTGEASEVREVASYVELPETSTGTEVAEAFSKLGQSSFGSIRDPHECIEGGQLEPKKSSPPRDDHPFRRRM